MLATRFSLDRILYREPKGRRRFCPHRQAGSDEDDYLLYLITRIGTTISQQEAKDIVTNILERGIINAREAAIMEAGLMDNHVSHQCKGVIRANMLRAMLVQSSRPRVRILMGGNKDIMSGMQEESCDGSCDQDR